MLVASSPMFRRLVLGGAFLTATLVAMLPDSRNVTAAVAADAIAAPADHAAAAEAAQAAADAAQEALQQARDTAREAREKAREAANVARDAARDARRSASDTTPRITIDRDGAKGERKIKIEVPGSNEEFDSFDQFIDKAPGIAAGVVLMFLIALLTPVIIIFMVIWYKTRKNRMINETLLKLAEKGVMPSTEIMQALGSGRPGAVLNAMPAGLPAVEQVGVMRKLAAWSDLRRGVILGSIGFALCMYSLLHSASANWFGLVLLFVGVGYAALWYFEDQQGNAWRTSGGVPTAPPSGGVPTAPPKDPLN